MKFNIIVSHIDNTATWKEDYNRLEVRDLNDAAKWGANLIDNFNATLRPGEKARKFHGVEPAEDSEANAPHEWHKTNLVTISDRTGLYDRMTCLRCNITAKRFGVDSLVVDKKFRAKKYLTCKGS